MSLALMGSVLLMGFLGSWHCGVMCGPLSCNFKTKPNFASYHLGRLISYLIVAGLLFSGQRFFLDVDSRPIKIFASLLFAVMFILFGLKQMSFFKTKALDFKYYKWQFNILEKNKKLSLKFPIVLGLLTGLFPCMWLYSFLILASRMESLPTVAIVVVLFWMTSLPAFFAVTAVTQALIKSAPISHQKISGFILILAGLFSVLGLWTEIIFL